jgi:zinc/manganese transport system ATP-binding protein
MLRTALTFEDLTLGYERHPVVHHLAGEVAAGSLLAIIGPNGAGKSTLLRAIAGELRPLGGRIHLHGVSRQDIGYLPQRSAIDESFPITVFDLVSTGLWRRTGPFRGLGRSGRRQVVEALATVGLEEFAMRPIGTLSGGQLQRTRFARLLLQDARLILLDEPYAAVDLKTVTDLTNLVDRWHGEGRTVLVVLHDIEHVRTHYPETLILAREQIARGTTAEVLTAENLFKARQLAEAFDENAPVCLDGQRRSTA